MKLSFKNSVYLLFTLTTWTLQTQQIRYTITTQLPKTCLGIGKQGDISLPGLKAYYKGYKIDLSKGSAVLPEADQKNFFSLVITPDIELVCSKNDNSISYLNRSATAPISWYDLSLVPIINDTNNKKLLEPAYYWNIEKRELKDIPNRLPDESIIILINPKLIHALQSLETTQSGSTMLPALVFNPEATAKEVEDAVTYAVLSSIDLDTVHTSANDSFTKARAKTIASTAAALAE